MKVAVAIDHRSEISAHFGRSPAFLVCTVRDGRIEQREVRANDQAPPEGAPTHQDGHPHAHAHDHSRFVRLLGDCRAVIGLGMGSGARIALESAGITVRILSAPCAPEEAVLQFESGLLDPDPGRSCGCRGHAQPTPQ
ncbi:MAG: iron-molybdenum cofactor biosynthesis protein [Holophagaceae bacterium]|uniref:Iron-molybdenum cofactor biosynthesis protein n=1 Tax=Candidatus Geothrix odensensis TaxID=2954440 RepID=A0A936F059_9BACT|nr:iron-molybdenum cofactor biosynthesis protein [Candidatus Geothrix odensensis]